jgi:hypothetical protein
MWFLSQNGQRGSLLVFVLAAFYWTKSLICNVAAFTGMLLYPESTLQLCSSRRFCEVFKDLFRFPGSRPDDVEFRSDAHQSATSARTTRTFRLDAHQFLEASNNSRLHPSGRNGKSSGRSSKFEKILVFQRIRPDDVAIPSGRRGYNVRTPFSVWQALGFLTQDTVMGRRLLLSGRCPL